MSTWTQIVLYSAVGCLGMFIQDAVGTFMVKAIGAGRAFLAGSMDAAGDIAKIAILSISGVQLTHKFGWQGFLGIIPIVVVGFATTVISTHLSKKFVTDKEDEANDSNRDARILALEAHVAALSKSVGKT